jgi:hypothetical protein
VGAIVLSLAGPGRRQLGGRPRHLGRLVKLALGAALLVVAARQFRGRPRAGDRAPLPGWMARLDDIRPLSGFGLAALLSGANPKNPLLAVGAARLIGDAISALTS